MEFCNDFLKCVISADSRGRFYSVPEDLPGFVKGVLAGKSIKLNEIPKVLRRALKTLPEAAASTLGKAASKFNKKPLVKEIVLTVDTPISNYSKWA